jgi:hypothetical protein
MPTAQEIQDRVTEYENSAINKIQNAIDSELDNRTKLLVIEKLTDSCRNLVIGYVRDSTTAIPDM